MRKTVRINQNVTHLAKSIKKLMIKNRKNLRFMGDKKKKEKKNEKSIV